MLHYDRTDISEGIDVYKPQELMSINLVDIAILNINGADYCCIINRINKSEDIKLMQNIDLAEKKEHYRL